MSSKTFYFGLLEYIDKQIARYDNNINHSSTRDEMHEFSGSKQALVDLKENLNEINETSKLIKEDKVRTQKVKVFGKKILDLIILLEDCDQNKTLTYEQIAYKILEKLGIETKTRIYLLSDYKPALPHLDTMVVRQAGE